ncbi:hypothetical protein B0T26DRAFT_684567 [Lasiosphaeria miniovina]|uniref:Uncharacterized protein n=1 Tax=Lasiosphaeria miniovina TaxID=1954250 RepID=A0AA40BFV6_9PEZI|nr:uncharacterized protein B0T26DRAFT_684567 [Lasiosphaeria miniovina]KAK0733482.1 hypothetical protein B0T26DRAFT_684567 [Lasiosphaeria miniovina]
MCYCWLSSTTPISRFSHTDHHHVSGRHYVAQFGLVYKPCNGNGLPQRTKGVNQRYQAIHSGGNNVELTNRSTVSFGKAGSCWSDSVQLDLGCDSRSMQYTNDTPAVNGWSLPLPTTEALGHAGQEQTRWYYFGLSYLTLPCLEIALRFCSLRGGCQPGRSPSLSSCQTRSTRPPPASDAIVRGWHLAPLACVWTGPSCIQLLMGQFVLLLSLS